MSASNNINDSFFAGSYKDAWRGISPHGLTVAEADLIIEMADLQKGQVILDLMCGYGRHAIEIAKRGIKVDATDNLPEYISEIQETAASEKLSITAWTENAAALKLEKQYDAVICMGNSFSFFERSIASDILQEISQHLKPGGILIINSWMIAEIAIRHFKEKDWHYAGDYKCILEYEYLFNPSRIESEQTIISKDGSVERVEGIDYIFSLDELEEMFKNAGLQTLALYSTPRKRKFQLGDSIIYIIAEKTKGKN